MKKINLSTILLISITFLLISCKNDTHEFDASGSFEAEETIISAQANGQLLHFDIEEGETLEINQLIGYIDTSTLHLKKKQVEAQINAILSKKPDVKVQLAAIESQLKAADIERNRIANLVAGDAATTKQLDDVNNLIDVLKKQKEALTSTLNISNQGITNEAASWWVQVEQINDQLNKSMIINPIKGTVLSKYAMKNEITAMGKPLFKIADLSIIHLRAYITGNQLPLVKLNQEVHVLTDNGNGGYMETTGTIIWISDQAEFTPKTIQTKDERANMVYAVKVKVKNDGTYKIGMYGEIKF